MPKIVNGSPSTRRRRLGRRDLADVDAAKCDLQIRDTRRRGARKLRNDLVVDALAGMNHLDGAAGLLGEADEERVAHVRADAEGVDTRRPAAREHLLVDLVLVADLTVGEEHDDAVRRELDGAHERREHLGAAAGCRARRSMHRPRGAWTA